MVIFLSNFLALLIKVDAGEEGDRAVFGGLLVAINVLLILAVVLTSWFAVQQSVDDFRGEHNSLTIATAMLTAEQYAANSAQLTRSARAQMPSSFFSVNPDASPSDDNIVKDASPVSKGCHSSDGTVIATSEVSVSDVARSGELNASTLDGLQSCTHNRGGPGSEEC